MITWVMVGLLLAAETCGRNVLSGNGNGNEKEEAKRREDLKGVSADEEDIYRLTCYTCVNVSDNQMCNEWAIDTPCPAGGRDFCQSMHILDSRGNSVLVSKACVSSEECGPGLVGCIPMDTQQICISCCDLSYCNIESPTNATNAIYSRKRRAKSKSKRKRPGRNGVGAAMRLYGPSLLWLPASIFYAYHC
ncbi:Ly6/PLAUR domain-containing protein 6B [Formica fusca]|uniref:ly6/PLAUR domain-containing protein 6B-like n=1 Tax=Formica exsecta TaxID=72781 RepID=UPI0011416DAC|nr:ly6/PLAUR domain-containing protein 6B-like [Formica exsecta]XP_029680655.1 ly6/PLAUR domain-containing protein 6B-like [Formica exsecta]XP_029680656.1 ly6/PLAUR domain-containing protein 6B-like [Formica exsecta]XP_029680657.1 ly6/PLAUR domain-containing protein 6B-like [Formica exsecta]XP_029680658.1 ly6/PLAUR domain-containing protein 6B-like [Formica exsecta]